MDTEDRSVLQMLREAPDELEKSIAEQLLSQLVLVNNNLEDLKLKVSITNEIQLELLELRKKEARRNSGVQARRYPDMPPPPIRRY